MRETFTPGPTPTFQAQRVLRCRRTGRYFTGHGWSGEAGQAQVFGDDIDAARACVTNDLHEVELVLRTELSGTEIFSTPVR